LDKLIDANGNAAPRASCCVGEHPRNPLAANRAILETLHATRSRRGECVRLEVEDVDRARARLHRRRGRDGAQGIYA